MVHNNGSLFRDRQCAHEIAEVGAGRAALSGYMKSDSRGVGRPVSALSGSSVRDRLLPIFAPSGPSVANNEPDE
jgi:hypothetical protein